MSEIEDTVAGHYTHGSLEAAILQGLAAMGRGPGNVTVDDLGAVDEFHVGGREATTALLDQLELTPGMRVLDMGSGIGGPARLLASRYGCRVTGVDLTPEFVRVAESLTRLVGLEGKAEFRQGSILALPLPDGSFDLVTLIHVGMNIQDKHRLSAEAARMLRPGGRIAIYDVMRAAEGPLPFPLPWAVDERSSFVETPAAYREALADAGFAILSERDRREAGLAFFARAREREAAGGRPQLGRATLLGEAARPRYVNLSRALEQGLLAPTELIARRA